MNLVRPDFTARWERHGEFSVYQIAQPIHPLQVMGEEHPELLEDVAGPSGWLSDAPGRTLAAVQVVVLRAAGHEVDDDRTSVELARRLLGEGRLLGSRIRGGEATVFTTYRLRPDGTVRFLLLVGQATTDGRIGRIVSALTDIETYRLLAMRAFPVAKEVQLRLNDVESRLTGLTEALDEESAAEQSLLHRLMELASQVQGTSAAVASQFSAARAYHDIVRHRTLDMRQSSVSGLTGVFTYLERRLLPAMATVEATAERLGEVSEHTSRAADLLRTRVGINTEAQNTELLRSLREGQATQLRLQETVEGLSIAAISYYLVGLIGYLAKAIEAAGQPVEPELVMGASVPFVVAGVWWLLRTAKRRIGVGRH